MCLKYLPDLPNLHLCPRTHALWSMELSLPSFPGLSFWMVSSTVLAHHCPVTGGRNGGK